MHFPTDDGALGYPDPAAYGVTFRNHDAIAIGCFSENISINSTLHAEISATMIAIETTKNKESSLD